MMLSDWSEIQIEFLYVDWTEGRIVYFYNLSSTQCDIVLPTLLTFQLENHKINILSFVYFSMIHFSDLCRMFMIFLWLIDLVSYCVLSTLTFTSPELWEEGAYPGYTHCESFMENMTMW